MSEYPEHDKLKAIQKQSQTIGQFLEWLGCEKEAEIAIRHNHTEHCEHEDDEIEADFTKGLFKACGYQQDRLQPICTQTEDLLAEFFDIDRNRLEDEKRAMLDTMRATNEGEVT